MKNPALLLSTFTLCGMNAIVAAFPAEIENRDVSERDAPNWMKPFGVNYQDSGGRQPSNTVLEINGKSPDINKGFGGKYVYLTYENTPYESQGLVDFWFHHQQAVPVGKDDLAKGSGGDYRWIDQCRDSARETWTEDNGFTRSEYCPSKLNKPTVKAAGLWRTNSDTTTPPWPWKWISADLNSGRGGDFLYIVTK